MNDAQLFTIFLSILGFGWLGFLAGRAWATPQKDGTWNTLTIVFFMFGSIGLFISMTLNLILLVGRNF